MGWAHGVTWPKDGGLHSTSLHAHPDLPLRVESDSYWTKDRRVQRDPVIQSENPLTPSQGGLMHPTEFRLIKLSNADGKRYTAGGNLSWAPPWWTLASVPWSHPVRRQPAGQWQIPGGNGTGNHCHGQCAERSEQSAAKDEKYVETFGS